MRGSDPDHFELRLILAQFRQHGANQIVAEMEPFIREPREDRPRGRDQSGLPGSSRAPVASPRTAFVIETVL